MCHTEGDEEERLPGGAEPYWTAGDAARPGDGGRQTAILPAGPRRSLILGGLCGTAPEPAGAHCPLYGDRDLPTKYFMWVKHAALRRVATRASTEPGTKRGRLGWWLSELEREMTTK